MNEIRIFPWPVRMAGRAANIFLEKFGCRIVAVPKPVVVEKKKSLVQVKIYDYDSLLTSHNHDFIEDPKFIAAYQRGMKAAGEECDMYWRVHVALWVVDQIKRLDGDFVECGVNKGIYSSCIMQYLNWNSVNKNFYLFDTFQGIDLKYLNERERELGRMEFSEKYYPECFEQTKENFKEFDRIHFIKGSVPETLNEVDIGKVCYLSIDMNCAAPEIYAAEYFWDKMVSGAMALLDDYAYVGYEEQKKAFDNFASSKGISILSLPTGQGLYIKP